MVYFQCYLSDNCRTWNCFLVGVSSKSFKYHHVPPKLLRVGHNVMVHWHNPILDSHRFPLLYRTFPGVHWKQIYHSSSSVSSLVFYILFASKSFESKRDTSIFLATPGAFICWTINRKRDHSVKVHCYIKYVRNLKKDYEILPYNAASMDKETYTEKCNHSFDDRYIPWISIF